MKKSAIKFPGQTLTVLFLSLLAITSLYSCENQEKIRIGSKDFSENIILGEIFAQLIERHTDLTVDRKLNLGGTFVCFEALKKGDIDLYPEYTGTGLTAQLKQEVMTDPDATYAYVREEFNKQFNLSWLNPLGFNNTYAIAIRGDLAQQYGFEKASDLSGKAGNLVFGGEHEFFNRQDGYEGFIQKYHIEFKDTAKMNVSLKYQAIGEGQMDVTDAFATDSQIIQYGLKLLEDDKHFFPPYYAAPVIRNETLEKHPELEKVLNLVSINDEEMTQLNYQVDIEQKNVSDVAKNFLDAKNL